VGEILIGGMASLLICIFLGPKFIDWLRGKEFGQHIREDGPAGHHEKAGTPTMGGIVIFVGVLVPFLILSDYRAISLVVLAVALASAALGFADDWAKIQKRRSLGISGRTKLIVQALIAIGLWLAATRYVELNDTLRLRVVDASVDLGYLYPALILLVLMGTTNGVNLTDGLDGLAIMPTVMIASALAVFAYVTGHAGFSKYLGFPFIPGAGELAVFCGAIAGAGLAFLWFNAYPAEVFMGDVGALALGAALGMIALVVRQEIVLLIMAGVFVVETLSVIIQVASFKLTGKRVFRMAPLHHHYELKGWKENQVVVRFWIITMMLVLFGLSTLKLR
jgi:phospho-N-acetylmuramoyl-pentapeptide-transferase